MNPTVTVVMPAYNAEKYLAESIESVLAQTFDDLELLIIDDGSTDRTAEIANSYCQQDNRVKLFSQENHGVSTSRNKGICLNNSKFVAFIDADDKWFSDKLAVHLNHFHLDAYLGISFARVEFLSPDGTTGQIASGRLNQLQPQHFLYENPTITTSNLVVRREVFQEIGYFDQSMSYAEDLDFILRVICSGKWKINGIDQVLMGYRTTEGGLSSNLYCMQEGWEILIDKTRKYAPDLVQEHYFAAQSNHLRYLARRAFRLRLPSEVGVDFMTRALLSDWQLMIREPRRSFLTMLAVYVRHLLTVFDS